MQTLRWILAIATTLSLLGFIALVLLGNGIRRSFGASPRVGPRVILTLLVQGGLLTSLVRPEWTGWLHATAAVVVALAAGCLRIWRESPVVGAAGLTYCGLWIGYYWRTAWAL